MYNVLLIGSGAVGLFYASKLQISCKVFIVCRSNYKEIKQKSFVVISSPNAEYEFTPENIYSSIEEASTESIKNNTRYDYILVAVKTTVDISDDLRGFYSQSVQPTIVLIQNGIGIEKNYALKYPNCCVLSCSTVISATQLSPGYVKHYKWTRIHVGPFSIDNARNQDHEKLALEFCTLLKNGGIVDAHACSSSDIQTVRFHKIIINATISLSSILSNGSNGFEMISDKIMFLHLKKTMLEIVHASTIILGKSFPKNLATVDEILKSIARNKNGRPSMLIDWENNNDIEIESIGGNLLSQATEHGIEMPRLETMYAFVMHLQQKKQSKL